MRKEIEKKLCKKNGLDELYFKKNEDNLIEPLVELNNWPSIRKEIDKGSGNELKSKFMSLASSSAIAVNAFGFFWNSNSLLWPKVKGQFNKIYFEKKLNNGLRGTPPNIDVLIENETTIVAIECKFLETLGHKKKEFSDQYFKIKGSRRDSKWFQLMEDVYNNKDSYKYLDVAQLIKHYMGLSFDDIGSNKKLKLAYVYWEPSEIIDNEINSIFKEHRNECERFGKSVKCDPVMTEVTFEYYSYFKLIDFWLSEVGGSNLERYFEEFNRKYRLPDPQKP